MMGVIGFIVGFLGFLLHQTIEWLTDQRTDAAIEYIAVRSHSMSFNLCIQRYWRQIVTYLFTLITVRAVGFLYEWEFSVCMALWNLHGLR